MQTRLLSVALLGALTLLSLSACDGADVAGPDSADATSSVESAAFDGTSRAGITPRLIEGNISGNGDAVCSNPAVVGDGNAYSGIKVDPPARGVTSYGDFRVGIDPRTGMYLAWVADGDAEVRHIVVKGGPDTFVYDYDGTLMRDGRLSPPPNGAGNCPEISHFTICYAQ